jgi:hypothetical protein
MPPIAHGGTFQTANTMNPVNATAKSSELSTALAHTGL